MNDLLAPVLPARRGRPSAATLAASLDASRRVNANLRLELRAQHAEGRAFAEEVRAHANRIHLAVVSDRPDLALHEAGTIAMLADRHARQRGGSAA